MARLVGVEHCLAVNSCTSALVCAYRALGIGAGDEVIVPGYTFFATAATVVACNAIPFIVDVDDTLCLSPEAVERAITKRTKAIVAVHMRGAPAQMDALLDVADRNGLPLIEDVAQAGGGSFHGRRLGNLGDMGCFSFDYYKVHASGEGGFNKCQPYYRRSVELYALRDEAKAFVRGYFNTIPSLLSLENLTFWEHFHNRGGWNKTHETGWFLCQTRIMLVQEREGELWLAPFVARNWLEDGKTVSVANAPTNFGPVSYCIESAVDKDVIECTVEPPTVRQPSRIVLRLRHPESKPIKTVTVNGKPYGDFDVEGETISLPTDPGRLVVRVVYGG